VGLLWTSDQLVAETSTKQYTTLTKDIHGAAGIRTRNLSRRAAADLRHCDWLVTPFNKVKFGIYLDCRFANFSTVPITTFVAVVARLADTPVVVMVTRTHRKWFALLIFPNFLLTHYGQIGFTAISNPCRLSRNYCVRQFEPVSIMRV
jgi:hypothetical protein